jgi:hypothetical protein
MPEYLSDADKELMAQIALANQFAAEAMRRAEVQLAVVNVAITALKAHLSNSYALGEHDEVRADGRIVRKEQADANGQPGTAADLPGGAAA